MNYEEMGDPWSLHLTENTGWGGERVFHPETNLLRGEGGAEEIPTAAASAR